MKPLVPEVIFFWVATVFYGVAAALQILAFLQKKEKLADLAMKFVWVGILAHTINFAMPAVKHNYTGI